MAHGQPARRASSNDDGLSFLLADLKEDYGGYGGERRMAPQGLTPTALGLLGPTDGMAILHTAPAHLLGAAASGACSALKGSSGSGGSGVLMPIPSSFIPVPGAALAHDGSGGSGHMGSPTRLLLHAVSGQFAQGGRPLTELDFISPDDYDDTLAAGAGSGSSGTVYGGGHLASLPSMEELRRLLSDPFLPQPAVNFGGGLAASSAQHGSHAGGPFLLQPQPSLPFLQPAAAPPAGFHLQGPFDAPSARFALRVKTHDGPAAGGSSQAGMRRVSSGGTGKRRASAALDGEPETAAPHDPRLTKHHSSSSTSAWSGGSGEGRGRQRGRGSTPRSGGGGRSRFGDDSGEGMRRQGSSHASEDAEDPAYVPSKRAAPRPRPPRQLSQQLPAQQAAAAAAAAELAAAADPAPLLQQFRGVSRHRLTQRWEASLWLNGRQLYLGGFNSQEDAARAYDLAALACKGPDAQVNFAADGYAAQLREVAGFSRDEVVAYVRRRSNAFARGRSRFRGVSGHEGRWEARIGAYGGRKNVSFGVFEEEEEAARQYDRALIVEKGRGAKTNFPLRQYEGEVAAYEAHLLATCGATHGPATRAAAAEYALPRGRQQAEEDGKKRPAVVLAEALRAALASTPAAAGGSRGGRR